MESNETIDAAASYLQMCKLAEEQARLARVAAEERVIELIGAKLEGATTFKTDNFKVTTTGKLSRSVDEAALTAILPSLPQAIRERVFPAKFSLSVSELRFVEKNEPDLYRRMAAVITTSPAKTAVAVEPIQ